MNDIDSKLLSKDIAKISIYSIDRDLEAGDIVYGYLTNPFKAKVSIIEPQYPFKVIAKYKGNLYLLGQKPLGPFTYDEIFSLNLDKFYVHFLSQGKDTKFEAGLPDIGINLFDEYDLSIRTKEPYWGYESIDHYKQYPDFACRIYNNRFSVCSREGLKLPIVPFFSIPTEIKEEPTTVLLNKRYREMYKLDYKVPCGKRYICEYKDCSLCQSSWRCMAHINADEFEIASKEELVDRLINNKCRHGRLYTEEEKATMKKVLKEFYDYEFEEEEKEK